MFIEKHWEGLFGVSLKAVAPFEIRGVKTIMGEKSLGEFAKELEREGMGM
ncbi:MAG: hypothetical protein RMI63_04705 [Caldimicrobium sp.]|nr:hypothetical protein [Caldimicrobium sp.]